MGTKINPLFNIFGIGDYFKDFDQKVRDLGWVEGCRWLIFRLGLNPAINLKNLAPKGSVLVYSNHPTGIDPFILAGILGREDYIFLGDLYQTKKGKSVAKHIIPIVSYGFWKEFFSRRPTNWPGYINMRLKVPAVSKEEASKFNKEALRKVVAHVFNGNLAAIFPSGGSYEFLPWKRGLSKVVLELIKKETKFNLYRININNFSELKLIFHFISGKRFFRNLEIVSNLIEIDKKWLNLSPQKLTQKLKEI